MRKVLEGLLVMMLFAFPILGIKFSYEKYYSGDTYYTKINHKGERIEERSYEEDSVCYRYHQIAYNEKGRPKEVDFTGDRPRPIKKNTYLRLTVHEEKGVTMWEQVKDEELPKKVKQKLD